MDEMKIQSVFTRSLEGPAKDQKASQDVLSDFKKALNQSVEELNRLQTDANQGLREMTMGKKEVHEAMIAVEQAGLTLRMMIQVRNKLLAAYEEIMRMQF